MQWIPRLSARIAVPVCFLLLQLALATGAHAELSNIPSSPLVANSSVSTFAKSGDTLFIGGSFSRIGLRTGQFVSTSSSTGDVESNMPVVSGPNEATISAVVPDGSGGWYLAGSFSYVGSTPRDNLAHILSNGSLDATFDPQPDGEVDAIALDGSTMYVGGFFQNIGGAARSNLAEISSTTGADAGLNADADSDVSNLALDDTQNILYVAGDFGTIGANDASRSHLAAVSTGTGNANGWNPNPTSSSSLFITSLALSSSTVYVGGDFDHIGANALARNGLAALNADNTGDATTWNPDPSNVSSDPEVDSVATSGSTVYVGGFFTQIGANHAARNGLAALDAMSANATSFDPKLASITGSPAVDTLRVDGSTLYMAGFFNAVGQSTRAARRNAAAVNVGTGNPTGWNPDPDSESGEISQIATAGTHVALVGGFDSFRGADRDGLAAVDIATGQLLPWNPTVKFNDGSTGTVSGLGVLGNTVYVAGNFSKVGLCTSQARSSLAAVDATTGVPTPWNPSPIGQMGPVAVSGNTVYVGGEFTVGPVQDPRSNLAALDATSGKATSFAPNPSNFVETLAISGSTLYTGGTFSTTAGQDRHHAAAYNLTTGTLTAWNPDTDDFVNALLPVGSDVYLGGPFTTVGGDSHPGVARVNGTDGAADATWTPTSDAVGALAMLDGQLYLGGQFHQVNSIDRGNVADLDPASGNLGSFDPNAGNNTIDALLALGSGQLALGGGFEGLAGAPNNNLALFGVPAVSSLPAATQCPSTPSGPGGGGGGGGGTPPPPPANAAKVKLSLKISRRQHVIRQHGLIVSALSDQTGTVTFSATVSLPKGAKVIRFKSVKKKVKAGKRVKVKLTLSKRNLAQLKRALARHKPKKLFAKVRVNARATAHPSSNKSIKVRLLR
jgi:hypothetical protein